MNESRSATSNRTARSILTVWIRPDFDRSHSFRSQIHKYSAACLLVISLLIAAAFYMLFFDCLRSHYFKLPVLTQQMPTAKNMFEKAKEYLNSPAMLKYQRNHIRFHIEYIGSNQQRFSLLRPTPAMSYTFSRMLQPTANCTYRSICSPNSLSESS